MHRLVVASLCIGDALSAVSNRLLLKQLAAAEYPFTKNRRIVNPALKLFLLPLSHVDRVHIFIFHQLLGHRLGPDGVCQTQQQKGLPDHGQTQREPGHPSLSIALFGQGLQNSQFKLDRKRYAAQRAHLPAVLATANTQEPKFDRTFHMLIIVQATPVSDGCAFSDQRACNGQRIASVDYAAHESGETSLAPREATLRGRAIVPRTCSPAEFPLSPDIRIQLVTKRVWSALTGKWRVREDPHVGGVGRSNDRPTAVRSWSSRVRYFSQVMLHLARAQGVCRPYMLRWSHHP